MTNGRDEHILLETANLFVSSGLPGNDRLLLREVSLTLREQEVLVVLGETGSGKTILCRSLTGLFPPGSPIRTGGSVRFEGRELLGLTGREMSSIRRRKIRYVFQDPVQSLNPLARIGAQMRLASDTPKDKGLLHDTLGLVGLDTRGGVLERYPHELSTGMAQRVCIAMAVIARPRLLIADEPTSAVDASHRRRILELLMMIQQSQGMALILITHDLDVARRYGDRIIVMHGGELVETAERRTFFETPRHPYSRLLVEAHTAIHSHTGPRTPRPGDTA